MTSSKFGSMGGKGGRPPGPLIAGSATDVMGRGGRTRGGAVYRGEERGGKGEAREMGRAEKGEM